MGWFDKARQLLRRGYGKVKGTIGGAVEKAKQLVNNIARRMPAPLVDLAKKGISAALKQKLPIINVSADDLIDRGRRIVGALDDAVEGRSGVLTAMSRAVG